MKIALVTDEWHPINQYVYDWLRKKGFECELYGAFVSKKDEPWASVTALAAKAVVQGKCEEGIFFCWSGTGSSIVANKIHGIRAALCGDSETAKLSRIYNHANVLVLSNRTLTPENAHDILTAWFDINYDHKISAKEVEKINTLEKLN